MNVQSIIAQLTHQAEAIRAVELHYAWTRHALAPHGVEYAGEWLGLRSYL